MQKAERELIEEKFKGVYLHQQSNFDLMSEKLDQIHKQTLLTNGRVSKVECETKVVRFFESNKIILIIFLLGIFFAATYFDLKDFIKML